jgi:hypothetical protein
LLQRLGYGLDGRRTGVRFSTRGKYFSLLHDVHTGSGAHPSSPTRAVGGCFFGGNSAGAISPGVCRQGLEADYSTPFSAEVKNGGVVSPLRLHSVMFN